MTGMDGENGGGSCTIGSWALEKAYVGHGSVELPVRAPTFSRAGHWYRYRLLVTLTTGGDVHAELFCYPAYH